MKQVNLVKSREWNQGYTQRQLSGKGHRTTFSQITEKKGYMNDDS